MKGKKNNFILIVFYIFVVLFFVGIFYLYKNMDTDVVKVEKIEFVDTEVSLKYGENYKIEYEIEPINATSKGVIWESSNPELVDVDEDGNLIVNSNASGEVTITATSKIGDATASFKVKVGKADNVIKVTGIKLDKKSVTLKYGTTAKLNASITPSSATNKNIEWTSSDKKLVSVDKNGNIKAVGNKDGEATITVKTKDGGYTASAKVKVTKVNNVVKVTGIKLDKKIVTLKYGGTIQLKATITPSNATNKNVEWTSSDTSLVTVDSIGNVKAVGNKDGEATITVKTKDGGKTTSTKVKVTKVETEVKVTGVNLDTNLVTLEYGKSSKLKATISPSNATNKNLEWTSSDPSLVTVDSKGNIKAVGNKNGTSTVTVKTKDGGKTASAKVKVTGIKVTGIKLDKTSFSLKYGESTKITATITPSNAANKNIEWISSNPNLVVVDNNGNVIASANKDGEATITVKTADGGKTASAKVKVKKVDSTINVTGIKVDKTTASLKYGESIKVNATITPSNATNKNVTWTSSDTSLVTVDSSGNIKAVGNKNGSSTVTVKTVDGGYSAIIKVSVSSIKVTGVSLNKSSVTLQYGSSTKLTATVSPGNAANKNVTWTSSNTSLVTVDGSGNIKAVGNKDGSATITVKTNDGGYTANCVVKVSSIKVTGVSLDKSIITLKYNNTIKVNATVTPSNAANKNVTWTSSNTSLVTVDNNGNIKAVANKDGTATVTVKTVDGGYSASVKVTVTSIKVTGVSLDKSSLSLQYGNSAKLTATVSPSNAANKNVTWTSSNTSLVTVDSSGNVKVIADKDGSATITVKTNDGGYTAKCTVTVKKKNVAVTSVKLNATSGTIYLNKTNSVSLTATVTPSNATNKNVTWTSSNTSVATVNSSGKVTAVGPGTATITVTTSDGSYKATYKLTVKKKVIIVIGASQVTRMKLYKTSYSSSNYNYKNSDGTLVYVEKSGSGIDYQTGDGWTTAKSTITSYKNTKSQVEFYIYFPLSGNTIKNFVCGSDTHKNSLGKISTTNSYITNYAKNYNTVISNIKKDGYTVKAYVVSMHPVRVSNSNNDKVVTNQNKNSCAYDYRSNWKYFQFNKAMKSIVETNYSTNLKYESLFIKIMETSDEGKTTSPYNFDYKIPYTTTDGVHWDSATTDTYVEMMLDYSGDL